MRHKKSKRTEDLMKQHLVRLDAVAGLLFVSFLSEVHARRVLEVPIPLANFTQLLQQDLAAIERPDP
jgi:hypothetical protein